MLRCESCDSLWVHWNKAHITKEQRQHINPRNKTEQPELWNSTCGICNHTQFTGDRVIGGVPLFLYKFVITIIRALT